MNPSDIFNRTNRTSESSPDDNQIYTVNGRRSFRIQRRPQAHCGIFPLGSNEEMTPLLHEPTLEAPAPVHVDQDAMARAAAVDAGAASTADLDEACAELPTDRPDEPEAAATPDVEHYATRDIAAAAALAQQPTHAEPLPEVQTPPTYIGWSAARMPTGGTPLYAGDSATTIRHVRGMPAPGADPPPQLPMYQFRGSNIQRNPLTGSGITEVVPKSGKRMVNKFGYRIID